MAGFLLRTIFCALVFMLVLLWIPALFVDTLGSAMMGMLIIGLSNAFIRTVLQRMSVPVKSSALGWSTLAVNTIVSLIVLYTIPGFKVLHMLPAVGGLLLVTLLSCWVSIGIEDR